MRNVCHAAIAGVVALTLFAVSTGRGLGAPATSDVPSGATRSAMKLRYNRDIRPILAENCFACHGPDSAARKAGLRLDRPEDATQVRNGRAAIVRGKPEQSTLVLRITGRGPIMPPRESHKSLTKQQIALLVRWIREGAEYERHWSFIPPKRPPLPKVKNAQWPRNPIDYFILAQLERAGLQPAPEADRRTLARRLSLDLTGLPPDPADVEAFVNDRSPNAYEKLVDKYLASPHWGEHRARYWLDAARYADTHGIHFDNYREMWSYRDWVIQAFNRNMPFDQFTIEQLAGDLLPDRTLDQLIATGFNRCNITTNEGGAIDEEYYVLYTRDRTETFAQVWLGMTANCAVCHDHKFDPLTMRDFYSLSAYFNNSTQRAMDGNIKDTPPVVPVPLQEDRKRYDALQSEIATVKQKAEQRRQAAKADFAQWLAQGSHAERVAARIPSTGIQLHLPLSEEQGPEAQGFLEGKSVRLAATAEPARVDGQTAKKAYQRRSGSTFEIPGAGDFEKDEAFTVAFWVKLPAGTHNGALLARMDEADAYRGWDVWIDNNRVAMHLIHRWPADALKVVTRDALEPERWHHLCLAYSGGANPDAVQIYIDGVLRSTDAQPNSLKNTIRTAVPLKIGQRHQGAQIEGVALQDIRLYRRRLGPEEADLLARTTRAAYLAAQDSAQLSDRERDELFGWWLGQEDAAYRELATRLATLEGERNAILGRGTVAHVWQEKDGPAMAYILFRGEYDKRRDPVSPATPAVLPPMPKNLPNNRLGLARWLLLPEHPLTARVTVNRFWQEIFGTGLVRTAGDFGVSGELPSHPELLDWLAVEFREKGWDVKRFFKMLVMSATYQQSAQITPDKKVKDPYNRLLSRGPRFRMDAEMIRDYALAASGLLVRKLGGPSVKPYQPDGVWEAVAMIGSNTREYRRDSGENLYRRSLYTFWKRAAPPASLEIFNAPNRETCVVRRERTNTPLQALVTLNDVQFVEAARVLAQKALREGGNLPASQVDYIARRLLARPLRPEEQTIVMRSLAKLQTFYNAHPQEAKALVTYGETPPDASIAPERLAAWTMLTNQLMNLDEVLNK
ncbi:MAG: DUF1553 domain-containing protein [Chloroherpetonaceae bacterium]|nr:DUF1553 domain-containing protein [Chloroherpetonaceae bacterium]